MSHSEQQFAVWLLPELRANKTLFEIISSLATRFNTPHFTPHVTLCTGVWDSSVDELKHAIDTFTQLSEQATCRTNGIDYLDAFFQCFYISLPDDAFSHFERNIRLHVPTAKLPQVRPHISLMYSNTFHELERCILKTEIEPLLPGKVTFNRCSVVLPLDNRWQMVSEWQQIHVSELPGLR